MIAAICLAMLLIWNEAIAENTYPSYLYLVANNRNVHCIWLGPLSLSIWCLSFLFVWKSQTYWNIYQWWCPFLTICGVHLHTIDLTKWNRFIRLFERDQFIRIWWSQLNSANVVQALGAAFCSASQFCHRIILRCEVLSCIAYNHSWVYQKVF